MLVTCLKVGDTVTLTLPPPDGRTVALKVLDVRGQKLRLGIAAPADVQVRRGEAAGAREVRR